ncbi:hypothetical protein LOK74_05925 [Brevibacillus humidisoli]|uniref:hypothetical protein n=1 Tax=Brevibacillus humidisoli TaxID=2895522 RepID=UPI001E5A1E26|nr:hypothetical protein [Brevibacillus humidisoli]UFJ42036.1 hypothetical protein LOK74_05925 [Brevibacillus humidisoli]
MGKLEKYLAKSNETGQRRTETVLIHDEEWEVRELTFLQNRQCYRLAEEADGRFDFFRYNDARIVKATEHAFPWHHSELLKAYKAKDKFEMPARLFNDDPQGYNLLLEAVNRVNSEVQTEDQVVEELKN